MKRIAIGLTVVVAFFALALLCGCNRNEISYTTSEICVTVEGEHPANDFQWEANANLYAYDGRLYYMLGWGENISATTAWKLGVLADGTGKILEDYRGRGVEVAFEDGAAYYLDVDFKKNVSVLHCYDLVSGETTKLDAQAPMLNLAPYLYYLGSDGVRYLISSYEEGTGYPIQGITAGVLQRIPLDYCIGQTTYTNTWSEHVIRKDADGTSTILEFGAGRECLIPYRDGLLVLNVSTGNSLHYIDREGTIIPLFETDAPHSVSTVNFHENYVFLSLQRYTEWFDNNGNIAENDEISGTYRIDMRDYSTEKISDAAYDGLFIFNGSGIYATDRFANVYQLDFDGEVIEQLINVG